MTIYILMGILVVMIFILIGILCYHKRQVRSICRQLAFLKEHDSNMLITGTTNACNIGELVDLLNDFLMKQKKLRKEYLEKEKIISDTYTSLSHDIRTPLTSLDGYFQLLNESKDAEEQKRYIAVIQERIGSLKEMLEELFTFTKLKNDSYQLLLEPCQLNRIVKETVFSYYEEWTGKQIEPEFMISEEALMVMGNAPALRRVLQNLIKNGLEHGEKKIRIILQKRDGEVCLEVWNQICTTEEIDVTKVFERFYKADAVRSRNSTGLGLAITREFVLRMNGTIEARVEKKTEAEISQGINEDLGGEFGVIIRFPHME